MTNTPDQDQEDRDFSQEEVGASLAEIFEEEMGPDANPVAERIAHRPRLLRYYEDGLEKREENEPRKVKKLLGTKTEYDASQDLRAYTVAGYRIELIDEFSELAEPRIDDNLLHPEHGVLETLEELLKKICGPGADQTDLRRRVMILTEISRRYRKDVR
ncbi:MAG: hypothetical protein Q8Q11_00980 [bacterium]|nr:hypothetical protein [bacterium]MDZ4247767.1 hypothetical protein [Patescibacteria group bacterium]